MMPYVLHLEKLSDRSRRAKEYGVYSTSQKGVNKGLKAGNCHTGTIL